MYYVYILYSKKLKKRYIGSSNDLQRRLVEHNSGNCSFTSQGTPWKLIYYEVFKFEKDARQEELFLKSGKGRERIKFLLAETMKNL
ncbi:hypothetical protein COU01_00135 [Candidatus Falkowbacteria bacterium CG10_big_fil_rev_8_21_14_0_10_44_15]|uniref:GIY-YIG domain-containing protein n=1 Tax=Candidatus Falkowbacteria bacterium CG10_big_fil_rev_8_21_14_0_10_44_15 TaxID=1974569 RepID=A0A2H0V0Y0_9BACT|nr:MAG: hypothetical protein COU01_00135 [Candidatus Falkowbacteria bacterium CG10_big_fil_rev_8_21_14_0_10_44_15]